MDALNLKKLGWLQSSGSSGVVTAACASIVLLLGLFGSNPVLAQSANVSVASPAAAQDQEIVIKSGVPGATPRLVPAPSTPVPSWAQQSYKIYLQMKARAHVGTVPNWIGVWTLGGGGGLAWDQMAVRKEARGLGPDVARDELKYCWQGNTPEFPCKGWVLAALTPQYALQFREKLTAVAHGVEWDPLSDCLPEGFPRVMIAPFEKEFIDTPKETWITALTYSDVRRINTDGRGHLPADVVFAMWDGDSIGFWDGDTLVVHTLYMRPEELQRLEPSLSSETSVIERIRMSDPNTIEDEATIYDPIALREPWPTVIKYVRETSPNILIDYYACDPNVYQGKDGNTALLIPGQSVTLERDYRNPEDDQNVGLDKVIKYGAEILKSEGNLPPASGAVPH